MKGSHIKGWLCAIPFFVVSQVSADVAQEPLFLGSSVPGNLAIVPSVEYPTVNSVANLDNTYDPDKPYIGYFDSNKCYDYQGSASEAERHFYPTSVTANMRCPGAVWSGNYLNWATTQTIDPFRWALTGGLRVKDTPTETWVEKARHGGQGNYFPQRTINGKSLVADLTPFEADWIKADINGQGKDMAISLPSDAKYLGGGGTGESSKVVYQEGFEGSGLGSGAQAAYNSQDLYYATYRHHSGNYSLYKNKQNYKDKNYLYNGFDIDEGFIFSGYFNLVRDDKYAAIFIADDAGNGYGLSVSATDNIWLDILKDSQWTNQSVSHASGDIEKYTWYKFELVNDGQGHLSLDIFDGNTKVASTSGTGNLSVGNFTRLYFQDGEGYYVDDIKVQSYTPAEDGAGLKYESTGANKYNAVVRVKVCDPSVGVEANCKKYAQGWKPEGLMQEYSDRIRYSVFGYLNDSNRMRDGGVLRASQRFIGLRTRDPDAGWGANSAAEWDGTTGVMAKSPDSAAATSTASYFGVTVEDSGAMNYINKFGELNNNNFKSKDPVSELYYTATRYFRGLPAVPEYSTRSPAHDSSPSSTTKARWVDGFPVVRTWEDPIQYSCQKNVILGIGDVYTHNDQNLPGRSGTSGEPARPAEVSDDTDVDVEDLNAAVGRLQGMDLNNEGRFGSTRNAGYMIGLAYDAHTRDIRDDLDGKQTVKTYWVDVLENRKLEGIGRNQFWLTAKYGGFEPRCPDNDPNCQLPDITGPYDADIPNPLPEHWWFTNGETLTQSGANLKRTDTYFPAGQADDMVEGLKSAFEDIAASLTSTARAVSFNSDQLQTDSLVFQALFDTNRWSGDLIAIDIDEQGAVGNQVWSAADRLDARASIASRKVFTGGDFSGVTSGSVTGGRSFTSSLGLDQDLVDYIRGDRSNESADNLRPRASRLGDIVNSSPQYIYQDNFGYSALAGNAQFGSAGGDYTTYRESNTYQNKPPVVVVGANDGMLHLFDGSDENTGGDELFAYIPSAILGDLHELADPDYQHRYFVDGTPRLGDAWLGAARGWRTLAVATTGAGGDSIFALDITDPTTLGANDVLWEYTNEKMGRLVQQPSLVALANGKFGVVVSSGYEAPQDEAYVWILDAADGSVISEFELPAAGGELGTPLVVDLQRDRISDRIYVGDTEGNLWRIDIDGSNTNLWGVPSSLTSGQTPGPLFIAQDAASVRQPITAPLSAAYNGNNDPMILFGTGSFHQTGDNIVGSNPQVQTLYGIFDEGSAVTSRSDLQQQSITKEVHNGALALRTTSTNTLSASDKGWYMDLYVSAANGGAGAAGERVVSRVGLTEKVAIFNTLIPSSDPCAGGGSSWFLALDYNSGSANSYQVFDVNGDGKFDQDDGVEGQVSSGFSKTDVGVSNGSITDKQNGGEVLITTGSKKTTPESVGINDDNENGRISWRELEQ